MIIKKICCIVQSYLTRMISIAMILVIGSTLFPNIVTKNPLNTVIIANATDNVVTVQFNQSDAIVLTLSSNNITFGDITGIQNYSEDTIPIELVATVNSSLSYDLDAMATGDFINKVDLTASHIPISKLGIKIDGGELFKFEGINIVRNLIKNAAIIPNEENNIMRYVIRFELQETIGYKMGDYEAPITIIVTQK